MESLNRMAVELVDEAIDFADELTIAVEPLEGDAAVLDFGVEVPGGVEAGLLLAEIQTAGLATVGSTVERLDGAPLTHVDVSTDHPALALLCAGKAGWELSVDGFEGLGSGPARALVAEEEVFARTGYEEDFELAVLALETETLPDETVAAAVAERAGVPESGVFLPAYSAASVTGSVVAASRAAELATYQLAELNYDPRDILSVSARAPAPPVAPSESAAIARGTDAVAYGGEVHLVVEREADDFEEIVSTAAEEYGTPFADIFAEVDWQFADLPPAVFGPAALTVDVVNGGTHRYGEPHEDILAESFGL